MFYSRRKKVKQQQLIRRQSQPNNLPPVEDYSHIDSPPPHSMNYFVHYKRRSLDNGVVDFDSLLASHRGHSSSVVYDFLYKEQQHQYKKAYRGGGQAFCGVPPGQQRFKVSAYVKITNSHFESSSPYLLKNKLNIPSLELGKNQAHLAN